MSKRMLISESEKNRIRSMHESYKDKGFISEGIDQYEANMGIQCFLNTKKIVRNYRCSIFFSVNSL